MVAEDAELKQAVSGIGRWSSSVHGFPYILVQVRLESPHGTAFRHDEGCTQQEL